MSKGELAKEIFSTGANCCQSVVLAFKDELKMDETELRKITLGMGGGVARLRSVCGAVSGMVMVLGYLLSDGFDKLKAYEVGQEACARFKEVTGSIICAEMLEGKVKVETVPKPDERTEQYYQKRPCAELVALASDIIYDILKEREV